MVKGLIIYYKEANSLNVKYIVMNGSSMPSMQEYVNGKDV